MKQKCHGFGFIEVLIALFLSGLLVVILIRLLMIFQSNADLMDALNDIQDRGRIAFFILGHDLRMAGYRQCVAQKSNIVPVEKFTDKTVPAKYSISAKKDTDILAISTCINNKMTKIVYFISYTNRLDHKNKKIYSLFEKRLPGKRRELIANVDNMEISKAVHIVEIGLLLQSEKKYLQSSSNYWFKNKMNSSQDHYLYEPWYFFIALRNKNE